MRTTAAATSTRFYASPLTIVKGKQAYEEQVQQLTDIAWTFAYTSFWNGMEFSASETNAAKALMQHFIQSGPPLQQYYELVQRILLARQYLLRHPGTYVSLPTDWLQEPKGFAGTQRWYEAVEKRRTQLPGYQRFLKALPEAVLDVQQCNTAADFHYWRSWFAERGAQESLNLFLSVVANMV
jgi:hypothetical protein